eukprot:sb/3465241/
MGDSLTFNIDNGYFDGLVRGFRSGILKKNDYHNLVECETLEDLKLHLQGTDYGPLLANDPSPLMVQTIDERLKERLVHEFTHIRNQCTAPMSEFLDYITYGYMIDNIILLITGTLRNRPIMELLPRCHPLGKFDELATISIAQSPAELFNAVMVDTPLAPFFKECVQDENDLDEMNIEILRNKLYKTYLEDFYAFCVELGGVTAEVMCPILAPSSPLFGDAVTPPLGPRKARQRSSRSELSTLYPEGLKFLKNAEDREEVRRILERYGAYKDLHTGVGDGPNDKTLEDRFFEEEVKMLCLGFMSSFHLGVFFAFVKLKEQENRNIVWIAECIAQKNKILLNPPQYLTHTSSLTQVKMLCLGFMSSFHLGVFFAFVKLKEQENRNIVWIAECIAQKNKSKIENYIPIF